jgi:hypothetical protein
MKLHQFPETVSIPSKSAPDFRINVLRYRGVLDDRLFFRLIVARYAHCFNVELVAAELFCDRLRLPIRAFSSSSSFYPACPSGPEKHYGGHSRHRIVNSANKPNG